MYWFRVVIKCLITTIFLLDCSICQENYIKILRDHYYGVSKDLINFSFNIFYREMVRRKNEQISTTTTQEPFSSTSFSSTITQPTTTSDTLTSTLSSSSTESTTISKTTTTSEILSSTLPSTFYTTESPLTSTQSLATSTQSIATSTQSIATSSQSIATTTHSIATTTQSIETTTTSSPQSTTSEISTTAFSTSTTEIPLSTTSFQSTTSESSSILTTTEFLTSTSTSFQSSTTTLSTSTPPTSTAEFTTNSDLTITFLPTTPNTLICTIPAILVDEYYVYNKSICFVNHSLSYDDSRNFCQSNEMELFTIRSSDQYTAVIKYASQKFSTKVGNFYWINGEKVDEKWKISEEIDLITEAIPREASGTAKCLSIAGETVNLFTQANECDKNSNGFFCEYVDENF